MEVLQERIAALVQLGAVCRELGAARSWPGHAIGLAEDEYDVLDATIRRAHQFNGWSTEEVRKQLSRTGGLAGLSGIAEANGMIRIGAGRGATVSSWPIAGRNTGWIATERSVKAHETRPDGRALAADIRWAACRCFDLMPLHFPSQLAVIADDRAVNSPSPSKSDYPN